MARRTSGSSTGAGRSQDRGVQLLDASEALFARQGVAATTVSDITEAAGVAKGTFYLYFDSKEQLLGTLKERFIEGMVDVVAEATGDVEPADIRERGDQLVAAVVDYELAHRHMLEVAVRESPDPDTADLFAEANRRMIGLIEAAIHSGASAGQVRVEDPETTASLIYFGLTGTLYHVLLYEEEMDRDRLVAAGQALVRRALGPRIGSRDVEPAGKPADEPLEEPLQEPVEEPVEERHVSDPTGP